MATMRELLSREPMTFNDLLDLFDDFLSLSRKAILKGEDMLREEIGSGEHEALGYIFGAACDAGDLSKRLGQIRTARNAGSDVTVTMKRGDANILGYALTEIDRLHAATANALALLQERRAPDGQDEDACAKSVITLAQRSLMTADDVEMAQLRLFSKRLREAAKYQEEAA